MIKEIQVSDYGVVKIIKGEYAGRFGYYDDDSVDDFDDSVSDDDFVEKAIVYFGDMLNNSKYYCIDYDCLTKDYMFDDLTNREREIRLKLWTNIGYKERAELMEEKMLIDGEIQNRLENYIEGQNVNHKKLFLSHSSLDKSIVISIALDLNERGISTWLDSFDILPGESIVSKINEGIKECNYMLLFLSNNSVKSKWVQKEWETFLWDEISEDGVKIIPIKLDNCEIPQILKTKKYIDFSTDYSAGLYELISTIKKYESKKSVS